MSVDSENLSDYESEGRRFESYWARFSRRKESLFALFPEAWEPADYVPLTFPPQKRTTKRERPSVGMRSDL